MVALLAFDACFWNASGPLLPSRSRIGLQNDRMSRFTLSAVLALLVVAFMASAHAPSPTRAAAPPRPSTPAAQDRELSALAPDADPQVLALAAAAMRCAQAQGTGAQATRLAVIDYSRSSLERRLWVFDLPAHKLLHHEWVAHGQGSGADRPDRFSNQEGTHASSLGLFLTADTYTGRNGYSMRMQGLEAGINDAAMSRAIVMHGAGYVDPDNGRRQGRLGRSWGCPAVRGAVAGPLIDEMKNGQFLFSYYPDQAWLARSAMLNCKAAGLAATTGDTGNASH